VGHVLASFQAVGLAVGSTQQEAEAVRDNAGAVRDTTTVTNTTDNDNDNATGNDWCSHPYSTDDAPLPGIIPGGGPLRIDHTPTQTDVDSVESRWAQQTTEFTVDSGRERVSHSQLTAVVLPAAFHQPYQAAFQGAFRAASRVVHCRNQQQKTPMV
jgi:hypothetical protein